MNKIRSILIAVCLAFASQASAQAGSPQQPKPCYEPQCPVASRGTAVVTVGDVMAKLMGLDEKKQDALLSDPKQINGMIESVLLNRQIANDVDPEKTTTDPALQARLRQAADDVLTVYRLNEIRAARITGNFETLASEYYRANKSAMHAPTSVTVRHLLVSSQKVGETAAKEKIEQLYQELQNASEAAFAEKVLELSDDSSKTSNGGIFKVSEDSKELVEEFSDAALALTVPGEISPPVETDYGYHLIQLLSREDGGVLTYEQAKGSIIERLRQDARQRVVSDYRGEILATGPLEVFPDNLARLVYGEGNETAAPADEAAQ